MNSICFFKDEIIDQAEIIFNDKKRLGHLHTHLKSKVSDTLTITILDQGIYKAEITKLEEFNCTLKILDQIKNESPWFHLLIGLSRPQTIKKVLEHSTTLGAASFNLFKAQLSEKSYAQSKIYEDSSYQTFLIDGLAQSKVYSHLPEFSLSKYLNLEKYKSHKNKFFLSLNTVNTFKELELSELQNPLLAIGPERGWTKKEESLLLEAGFSPIKISQSVLRVEHAVYTSVGQLEMLRL
ncbi:RsmE family RNA methyltransferase [Halobacteriovorax sp.]|uniref:RsmE family RNA methyltransferase n=1 Tax=Halobacteriovorax sp. TaxID=2020862 RepID=UPI0035625F25